MRNIYYGAGRAAGGSGGRYVVGAGGAGRRAGARNICHARARPPGVALRVGAGLRSERAARCAADAMGLGGGARWEAESVGLTCRSLSICCIMWGLGASPGPGGEWVGTGVQVRERIHVFCTGG